MHLVHNVMGHLEGQGDLQDVLAMRLVAKEWHAAFREYPTSYNFLAGPDDLQKWLNFKSNMSSLQVHSQLDHTVKLNPLQTASSLTSLIIRGNIFHDSQKRSLQPLVKLSKLPSSLRCLILNSVYADPAYFSKLACTALTNLTLHTQQNTEVEIVELLYHLPLLQVVTHTC